MIFVQIALANPDDDGDPIYVSGTGYEIKDGSLATGFSWLTEQLKTPGVDSFRVRKLSRQPSPLTLQIVEPLPQSWTHAEREDDYTRLGGQQVKLIVPNGSDTRTWTRVLIPAPPKIILRGQGLFGSGSVPGSTATLIAEWTLLRQVEG